MKTVAESGSQTTLQTVERALDFLEFVAASAVPPTIKQVSQELGLNITTCYHLFRTLHSRGYLDRGTNATLTVGNRISPLFVSFQRTFDADTGLRQIVERLSLATSETAFLSTLQGSSVVLKVLVEGPQQLRVSGLYVGLSGNEHHRASGKSVLAHAEPALRNAILDQSMSGIATDDRETLLSRLSEDFPRIREQGWSIDNQQADLGIASIGAPVFDSDGAIHGAIGIVSPSVRLERSREESIALIIQAAGEATDILRSVGALELRSTASH